MGLDMYVYRLRKPNLDNSIHDENDLRHYLVVDESEYDAPMYMDLIPYYQKIQVRCRYYDFDKIAKNNGCKPGSVHWAGYWDRQTRFRGTYINGEDIGIGIPEEKEDEYIYTKIETKYAVQRDGEVAYWRKHYDLQGWFYDHIDEVENCGFYKLDRELLESYHSCWFYHDDYQPIDFEETDESALFYHEWY